MIQISLRLKILLAIVLIFSIFSCCNELSERTGCLTVPNLSSERIYLKSKSDKSAFEMVSINFSGTDEIILADDIVDMTPYTTNVRAFRIGKSEVSYNTWYEVRAWAEENGYLFAHKGSEGMYGSAALQKSINEGGIQICIT